MHEIYNCCIHVCDLDKTSIPSITAKGNLYFLVTIYQNYDACLKLFLIFVLSASGPSIRTDHPLWPHCDAELDDDPAGYSSLEVDCVLKCARKYVQRKGTYNALTNNCHHFANMLSLLLCTVEEGYCWTWCLY